MANGKIRFGKQSGGQLALVFPDGVDNTEVVFPESGELVNKDYADLKQSKSEVAYDVNTSSYIPNTLESGAIIERGSNANGEYVKFADGTLICRRQYTQSGIPCTTAAGTAFTTAGQTWTFPYLFIDGNYTLSIQVSTTSQSFTPMTLTVPAKWAISFALISPNSTTFAIVRAFLCAIGRWK